VAREQEDGRVVLGFCRLESDPIARQILPSLSVKARTEKTRKGAANNKTLH